MSSPLRRSKRNRDGETHEEANPHMDVEGAAETLPEQEQGESDAVESPLNKKPRKDTAEANEGEEKQENSTQADGEATETKEEESKEEPAQEAPPADKPAIEEANTNPTNSTEEAAKDATAETAKEAPADAAQEATAEVGKDANAEEPAKEAAAEATEEPAKRPDEEAPVAPKQEDGAAAPAAAPPAAPPVQVHAPAPAVAKAPAPAPPPPIYKQEEEYEEPDDGAEILEDEDNVWNAKVVELLLYKHQYRTLHVQATYDQHLHAWVDIQRKLYRRHRKDPKSVSALTARRITALDAMNFPFTLRGAAHWDRYFAKLKEFKDKHGHCLVPRLCEFAGLGDWVIDQRRQYKLMMQGKPSVLDPERQRKLEDMGFVWVVRNRPEWNNRYQELLQYKSRYGDCKVPQHYKEVPGLGKWVAKQREQYRLLQQGKHSFLTPDRLEKLNDAGFVWSVRKDAADDMAALASKKKQTPLKKEELEDLVKAKEEEKMPPVYNEAEAEKPKLEHPGMEAALDAAAAVVQEVQKEEELKEADGADDQDGTIQV